MKYTNRYGLPGPLYTVVAKPDYRKAGDISITRLISSPRQRLLGERHDGEITVDVSEELWSVLGQSVHYVLHRAAGDGCITEKRFSAEVSGWEVTGIPDLLEADGTLSDYKVTSVYSFLLGEKPEWSAQMNVQAWLLRRNGVGVKRMQIVAMLRDWSRHRAAIERDYPKVPAHVLDIPMWSDQQQDEYVQERVKVHQAAEKLADDELPECTKEERWSQPQRWAVRKTGNKRALKLFDSLGDSTEFLDEMPTETRGKYAIESRPGKDVRCESFCKAAPFCNQWAKNNGETK